MRDEGVPERDLAEPKNAGDSARRPQVAFVGPCGRIQAPGDALLTGPAHSSGKGRWQWADHARWPLTAVAGAFQDGDMEHRFRAAILAVIACAAVARAQGLTGEQARIVEEARAVALNYSNWLPNLICTEHIQRSADWYGSGSWAAVDTITAQVTYFERHESYKVIARNNHAANQAIESVAGAISKGEFGSMLRWIFDPAAKASFEWKGRQAIRRQPVSVFAYRVEPATSRLELRALAKSAIAGFHGVVYIDDATKLVLRLTLESDGPKDFPIRDSYVHIDYDWATIAGSRYLVPSRAETGMTENRPPAPLAAAQVAAAQAGRTIAPGSCSSCDPPGSPVFRSPPRQAVKYRNRLEFRGYRQFTTDSKLTFDPPKPGLPQ